MAASLRFLVNLNYLYFHVRTAWQECAVVAFKPPKRSFHLATATSRGWLPDKGSRDSCTRRFVKSSKRVCVCMCVYVVFTSTLRHHRVSRVVHARSIQPETFDRSQYEIKIAIDTLVSAPSFSRLRQKRAKINKRPINRVCETSPRGHPADPIEMKHRRVQQRAPQR